MTLGVAIPSHDKNNEECPFCVEKDGDWTTWVGEENNSKILRSVMTNPEKLTEKQKKARPKDDGHNRQSSDGRRFWTKSQAKKDGRSPSFPIYENDEYGPYSDEAHHALSGNQILKGDNIEKLTSSKVTGAHVSSDTGYSVNNCANGVCLPSYPVKFRKRNSKPKWGEIESDDDRYKIMTYPMNANMGQAHIGAHDIPPLDADSDDFEEVDDYDDGSTDRDRDLTYPKYAKKLLKNLYKSAMPWAKECPFCEGKDSEKGELPPPYRINQYLDNISEHLIQHIRYTPPESWEYFLSEYAKK